jgi:hypothetical protein
MASDVDTRPLKRRLQMSRRALFPFLPEKTRKHHFDEQAGGEYEQRPVVVHATDLQLHATQQVDQLLRRLEERADDKTKQPITPGTGS